MITSVWPGPAIDEGQFSDGSPLLQEHLVIEIQPTNRDSASSDDPVRLLYPWSSAFELQLSAEMLDGTTRVFFAADRARFPDNVELVGPRSGEIDRSTLYFAAHPAAVLVVGSDGSAFPLLCDEPPAETAENLAYLESVGLDASSVDPPPTAQYTVVTPASGPIESD